MDMYSAPVRLRELPDGGGERRLWDALELGNADIDTLCTRSALPAHEGSAASSDVTQSRWSERGISGASKPRAITKISWPLSSNVTASMRKSFLCP